jgi:regulator of sigma E protease
VTVKRGDRTLDTILVPEANTVVRVKELGLSEVKGRIQVLPVFIKPMIAVEPGSAAYTAGLRTWDLVLAVDGKKVTTIDETLDLLVTAGPKAVQVLRQKDLGTSGPGNWAIPEAPLDVQLPAGAAAGITSSEFVVHRVDPGTAAQTIGLQAGDRVLSLDGVRNPLWSQVIYTLADEPEKTHVLEYQRGDQVTKAEFKLVETSEKGEFNEERRTVTFGAYNHGAYGVPELVPNPHLVAYAATQTWTRTADAVEITALSLAGLFKGRVKMKDMGGPIMIYDMAAKTSEHGWEYFFRIMVWLSVSLGIINLVPIPILDGGHLFFFLIEGVIRRPVPLKVRQIAAYIGLAMILLLMVVVFANDIQRNWGLFGDLF